MKKRGFAAFLVAGFMATLSQQAISAAVGVGKDFSLDNPAIARVEVLGFDNLGDPDALVTFYSAVGSCLTYAYESNATLNQSVRLAFFDAANNVLDLPILSITNGFYNSVDPACGVVNVPPVAQDDPYGTTYEGQNVLSNDSDANGDTLTANLVSGPQNGSLTLNPDGTFTYTPNTGFSGSDTFTYRANDGQVDSNTATVSLTVEAPPVEPPVEPPLPPENQRPVAVDDPFGTSYEGANVLTNDSDPDGDELTAILLTPPENGTLQLSSSGNFTYTPDEGFLGRDFFTYRASDGDLLSNTATVSLTVEEGEVIPPENQPPLAVDDPYGIDYEGKNVLVNDSDPEGDPLSARLVSGTRNGTLRLNPDGTFTYTPELGFSGQDSFTYRANDGELDSNVALVSLTVELPDENLPPVAIDDPFGGEYAGKNVLANDTDPNGDNLIAILASGPEGGDLTLNTNGSFSYKPYAGFSGNDSFTYYARDRALDDPEGLDSNVATVSLSVDGEEVSDGGVTDKTDADGTSVLKDASPTELQTSMRIDRVCPRLERVGPKTDEEEDLLNLCSNLRKQGTTAEQALTALRAITPEEIAAISKSIRVLSFSRFRNLGARIARVRGGSKGLSVAGLNLKYDGQTVSGRELDVMAQEALGALGGGASGDELREDSRLGLFVRGDLNFGEQKETELESGFDFDAQSLTLGADYRFTDTFFAGASFSLGQTEVDFSEDGGDTEADDYALAVYGSWYSSGGWYLDGILSYGWSDIETKRHIVYRDFGGEVDRTAEGSTDGNEYYISVNAGYNFNFGGFNFDPLVRFFYLDAEVDAFTESGADGWDLDISDQGFESMSLGASAQLSYTFLPSWGVITPYLRIEYTQEFEDSADGVKYRFANDPFLDDTGGGEMTMTPDDPESNYMVYGAGFASQFRYGISAFVSYQRLGSYENLDGEMLSFGMRWEARF